MGREDVHPVFELVMTNQAKYPVRSLCHVLKVSPSGLYAWRDRPPSQRSLAGVAMTGRIRTIHAESDDGYGMPRVRAELIDQGVTISCKRVARLM